MLDVIPGLSKVEMDYLAKLRAGVSQRRKSNDQAELYFEGTMRVKNLDIAVPPSLQNIGVSLDWAATVVNSHHERMNFLGWDDSGRFELGRVADILAASTKVSEALLDSMIFGVGFLAVEPKFGTDGWVLRTISPKDGTLLWDTATDEPLAGYRMAGLEGGGTREVLYLAGQTVYLTFTDSGVDVQRVETIPGVVPVIRLRNQLRSRRWYGQSMITPTIRYYVQAACRTLLGMEINREFYTTPQRWAMNADMAEFTKSDDPSHAELVEAGWKATMGRMLALPAPEPGEPEARVGQFSASPPTPYIEALRAYSQMVSAATGIPVAYLGFYTETPPSGDAIRAWLERLTRSVEAQQKLVSQDLRRLGWLLVRATNQSEISWEEFAGSVVEKWEPAATTVFAADTDAITKLVAAGVAAAQSDWVFDKLGVDARERNKLRSELSKAQGLAEVKSMLQGARAKVAPEAEALAGTVGKAGSDG